MNDKKLAYDTVLYLLAGDVRTGDLRIEEVLNDLKRLVNTLENVATIVRYLDREIKGETREKVI